MTTDSPRMVAPGKEVLLTSFRLNGQKMVDSLRALDDSGRRVPGMSWTAGELGAHLVTSLGELTKAVGGRPCAYDGAVTSDTVATVDQDLVSAYPERNLGVLAEQLTEQQAAYAQVVEARPGTDLVPAVDPQGSVNSITSIFVLDYHNHGSQVAALGPPWALDVVDVRGAVAALVPAIMNHDVAKTFKGRFALRLRGADPLDLSFDRGRYSVGEPLPRVDCHLVADPVAFLRLTAGEFITQRHAVLTGKLLAYGRKPWLALGLLRVLPPMTHGGRRTR
jgi:hypothetical protein